MAVQKIETRAHGSALVLRGSMNIFLHGHLDSVICAIRNQTLALLEELGSVTQAKFGFSIDRTFLLGSLVEIFKNCHDAYASLPSYSKKIFETVRVTFVVSSVKKAVSVIVTDRAGSSPTTVQKKQNPHRYFGGEGIGEAHMAQYASYRRVTDPKRGSFIRLETVV